MAPKARPALSRLLDKLEYEDAFNGCWIYPRRKSSTGYIVFDRSSAHVIAYEAFRGEIPPGMQVDHLCKRRNCCNPNHLQAVTPETNRARQDMVRTHCRNGHPYAHPNIYVARNGQEHCRECRRDAGRRYETKRKNKGDRT